MAEPKVVGIETEYANFLDGPGPQSGFPERASRLILAHVEEFALRTGGARTQEWAGYGRPGSAACGSSYPQPHFNSGAAYGSEFTIAGARIYEDHCHCELSTQECLSARDLVACVKAGDAVIDRARRAASRTLGQGDSVVVLANNTDGQGNSYAGHLNVLMSRAAFDWLFDRRPQVLYRSLVPFLVSSPVITGAGKVGAENGADGALFQISQRADFIETAAVHGGTTSYRPLINSRDEPLADRQRYGRLHLIVFDTNRMEWALWLKAGMTQLIVAMVEDAVMEDAALLPDLTLTDPVAALHTVSRDLSLREPLALEDGRDISAVEMQAILAEAAGAYVDSGAAEGVVPEADAIVEAWLDTLALLERADLNALSDRLDWVAKLSCIAAAGLPLDDPRARVADLRYADIDPERGLYDKVCRRTGRARSVTTADALARMETGAPTNTRAYIRSELLRRFAHEVISVDWQRVTVRDADGSWWFNRKDVELGDPTGLDAPQVEGASGAALNAVDLGRRLDLLREPNSTAGWGRSQSTHRAHGRA
jgi:hypothetical protein